MKKLLSIFLAALAVLSVSCNKDDSDNKIKYGADGVTPLPKAVDLGLSVKWASFNLGASKEYEFGDYYAWGETAPKNDYSLSTYKYTGSAETLEPSNDVARVKLGGAWRMPTFDEIQELLALQYNSDYTWAWTTAAGKGGKNVPGVRITHKFSGASMFIPAAGYCDGTSVGKNAGNESYYWTSTIYPKATEWAWSAKGSEADLIVFTCDRFLGFPVRPVSE